MQQEQTHGRTVQFPLVRFKQAERGQCASALRLPDTCLWMLSVVRICPSLCVEGGNPQSGLSPQPRDKEKSFAAAGSAWQLSLMEQPKRSFSFPRTPPLLRSSNLCQPLYSLYFSFLLSKVLKSHSESWKKKLVYHNCVYQNWHLIQLSYRVQKNMWV